MKMKEIGPGGRVPGGPLRSATGHITTEKDRLPHELSSHRLFT